MRTRFVFRPEHVRVFLRLAKALGSLYVLGSKPS